jgi:hypothetical protein
MPIPSDNQLSWQWCEQLWLLRQDYWFVPNFLLVCFAEHSRPKTFDPLELLGFQLVN